MPTDAGLRLYVDGLLEIGNVTDEERREIEGQCAISGRSIEAVLSDASNALSALSRYAGIVTAPPTSARSSASSSCRSRRAARW